MLKSMTNSPPVDVYGNQIDTSTPEGRSELVHHLVNREILIDQAELLGLQNETTVDAAHDYLSDYHGVMAMRHDKIEKGKEHVTNEEVDAYYRRLQETRVCHVMLVDKREDALAARERILDGESWRDVARDYHVGPTMPGPDPYLSRFRYGYVEDTFEEAIYSLQPDEVSQPIDTKLGYWLVRLERREKIKAPPLDDIAARAAVAIYNRKVELAQQEFMAELHEKYGFELDEDAAWTVYEALPANEPALGADGKPILADALEPLQMPADQLDRVLTRYVVNGVEHTYTIAEFKADFDGMNSRSRPKRSQAFGILRKRLEHSVDRQLVVAEAKAGGFLGEQEVQAVVDQWVNELMIDRLVKEFVDFDDKVAPALVDSVYNARREHYMTQPYREGRVVYCETEQLAGQARVDAAGGEDWPLILDRYGTDQDNIADEGQVEVAGIGGVGPAAQLLVGLEGIGSVAGPQEVDGRWLVVRLERFDPPRQLSLNEASEQIATEIKQKRRNEALRQALADWRRGHDIEIHDERCASLPSWNDLQERLRQRPEAPS
jgi:parvulin-like peptidyl-prolyl isomerase